VLRAAQSPNGVRPLGGTHGIGRLDPSHLRSASGVQPTVEASSAASAVASVAAALVVGGASTLVQTAMASSVARTSLTSLLHPTTITPHHVSTAGRATMRRHRMQSAETRHQTQHAPRRRRLHRNG
jgi:uncharacterized cupredoxin-like copper-binding protein